MRVYVWNRYPNLWGLEPPCIQPSMEEASCHLSRGPAQMVDIVTGPGGGVSDAPPFLMASVPQFPALQLLGALCRSWGGGNVCFVGGIPPTWQLAYQPMSFIDVYSNITQFFELSSYKMIRILRIKKAHIWTKVEWSKIQFFQNLINGMFVA